MTYWLAWVMVGRLFDDQDPKEGKGKDDGTDKDKRIGMGD